MSTTAPTGRMAEIPTSAITVRDGWNPRTNMDPEALAALVTSISAQGILQPLLVDLADDTHILIDGHRRLAAATQAGLNRVPVIIRDGDPGAAMQIAAALAANQRRVNLGPIEEAAAFARAADSGLTTAGIAAATGCTQQHVTKRLALLDLPEQLHEAVNTRTISLAAADVLLRIAAHSAPLAHATGRMIIDGHTTNSILTDRPMQIIAQSTDIYRDSEDVDAGIAIHAPGTVNTATVEQLGDTDLAKTLTDEHHGYIHLDQQVVDEARAYGCLLALSDEPPMWGPQGLIIDADFALDRVRAIVAGRAERRGQDATRESVDATWEREKIAKALGVEAEEIEDWDEARLRAEKRRIADDQARSARIMNLDLDRRLALALDEPAQLPRPVAELITHLVFSARGSEIAQGMRLCAPALRTVTTRTLASGQTREKTTYTDINEALEHTLSWVLDARESTHVLGRLAHALVASAHADEAALAPSHRRGLAAPYGPAGAAMRQITSDIVPTTKPASAPTGDADSPSG